MNQYCYDIISEEEWDENKVKAHVEKIYRKKKFNGAFATDEKIPFLVIVSSKDAQVCIKLTSRAKKTVERIEDIHKQLKAVDLKVDVQTKLGKPALFQLEQCNWWEEGCELGEADKWVTLEHHGPYFTHLMEPYVPHGAPLLYEGKKYKLDPEEERIANFYARRIISEKGGTVIVKLTQDPVFNKNFWTDFKTYLNPEHKKIFKDFTKVNFAEIVKKLEKMKEAEKELSEKQKTAKKVKTAERKQDYGYAIINGVKEPVSNFVIEPAAIFFGRGENPKRGKIKRDIEPEEVTINIGETVAIPEPPEGHEWGEVIHDHHAAWIARWHDPISGEPKYVYLGAEGQLKGKSDYLKYEKARKLNKFIDTVREKYQKDITNKDARLRQLGTVLYLIDRYGLRVGNEKDEAETDTVGASTLRVEHVKLKEPSTVIFDFLGKDSIRYYKEIPVEADIYKNFKEFLDKKKPSDAVFDLISAADINNYLKTFDKDFSAKVFRTRLGSSTMDTALKKAKVKKDASQDDKKKLFDKANIVVAEILNHRRTVPPKAQETIAKYQKELKELRKQLKETKAAGKSTASLEKRIKKKKDQIEAKKDTLNIAITTSKTNYIDPRVAVAWSKKHELNIPKVYTATLQRKFTWAINTTDPKWDYTKTPLLAGMDELQPAPKAVPKVVPKAVPKVVPKAVPKVVPKAKPTTKILKPPSKKITPGVKIIDYTDKSIAVLGDTTEFKETLMGLGGKWNPNLTVAGKKVKGWIFSKKKRAQVEEALELEEKVTKAPVTSDLDLIAFYLDQKPSMSGYTLAEILGWDKLTLEQKHDYIQTLFPLYEPGMAPAPLLGPGAVKEFRENPEVRKGVVKAYLKMLDFYGYQIKGYDIVRTLPIKQVIDGITVGLYSPHNYLRISRMLTFLHIINMSLLADLLFLGLCRDLKQDLQFRKMVNAKGALKYWMSANGIEKEIIDNYDTAKMVYTGKPG